MWDYFLAKNVPRTLSHTPTRRTRWYEQNGRQSTWHAREIHAQTRTSLKTSCSNHHNHEDNAMMRGYKYWRGVGNFFNIEAVSRDIPVCAFCIRLNYDCATKVEDTENPAPRFTAHSCWVVEYSRGSLRSASSSFRFPDRKFNMCNYSTFSLPIIGIPSLSCHSSRTNMQYIL